MATRENLHSIAAALEAAAGPSRLLDSLPPADVTMREAAKWLRCSAPTAGKLLESSRQRVLGAARNSAFTVPITKLAALAKPSIPPPLPWRVAVVQPTHEWAACVVASGLTQGFGLIGRSARLVDLTPSERLSSFGSSWPNARRAVGLPIDGAIGTHAIVSTISALTPTALGLVASCDLVLLPYSTSPRSLQGAADVVRSMVSLNVGSRRLLLLPWIGQARVERALQAVRRWTWTGLPDLDLLESAGCMLTPLNAQPPAVPPRLALALRSSLADLCWTLSDRLSLDHRR